MQRLFNLDKWHEVKQGKVIHFETDRPRVVRLEVNVAGTSVLGIVGDKGSARFLALVTGRDVIEFHVGGSFGLVSDGDPVWIYTVDGDRWTYEDPAPEIFTRMHQPRIRNHELEVMMAKVQQNMERRLAKQADEIRRDAERRAAAQRPQQPAEGDAGPVGQQPASPKGKPAAGGNRAPQPAGADSGDGGPDEP